MHRCLWTHSCKRKQWLSAPQLLWKEQTGPCLTKKTKNQDNSGQKLMLQLTGIVNKQKIAIQLSTTVLPQPQTRFLVFWFMTLWWLFDRNKYCFNLVWQSKWWHRNSKYYEDSPQATTVSFHHVIKGNMLNPEQKAYIYNRYKNEELLKILLLCCFYHSVHSCSLLNTCNISPLPYSSALSALKI